MKKKIVFLLLFLLFFTLNSLQIDKYLSPSYIFHFLLTSIALLLFSHSSEWHLFDFFDVVRIVLRNFHFGFKTLKKKKKINLRKLLHFYYRCLSRQSALCDRSKKHFFRDCFLWVLLLLEILFVFVHYSLNCIVSREPIKF